MDGLNLARSNTVQQTSGGQTLEFRAHPRYAATTYVGGGLAGWPTVGHGPPRPHGEVTLALIGGQRLLREATAGLLGRQDGLRLLGTFDSVADYLEAAQEHPASVALLDCEEEDPASWSSLIASLRASNPDTAVMLLCGNAHEDGVRHAIEQGVTGVILKSYGTRQIREAIAYVATGRTVMPAGWQRMCARPAESQLALSPRQRQILGLIAQGQGNEEIATGLDMSPNTVKFHIRALYSRLGVRNRVEAANQYAQMTRGGG
jgi:DNA-binding NarL/FixJ family response regulator